jgi:hypothetical protein
MRPSICGLLDGRFISISVVTNIGNIAEKNQPDKSKQKNRSGHAAQRGLLV